MFSIPPEAHRPLLDIVEGRARSGAFAIGAMPINVARAVVRRAWIGQAPPRAIEFREQSWSELTVRDIVTRVSKIVAEGLGCDYPQARWLVGNARVPIILIFATRPVPTADYVEELRRALPDAVLLFLGWSPPMALPSSVIPLPGFDGYQFASFLYAYKQLMELIEPRGRVSAQKKKSGKTARLLAKKSKTLPARKK
jgi:hypothetical protein